MSSILERALRVIAAAYIEDRAHQYKESSGSFDALINLAEEFRNGEALASFKHGELDDIIQKKRRKEPEEDMDSNEKTFDEIAKAIADGEDSDVIDGLIAFSTAITEDQRGELWEVLSKRDNEGEAQ